LPGAVAESRIVSPFLMSAQAQDTAIVQSIRRKGILAGVEVQIDLDGARKREIDVAAKPRSGRRGANLVGTISYRELASKASDKFCPHRANGEDVACMLYTSGTTARPKGVLLTQRNFVSAARLVASHLDVRETDVVVAVLPFFHVFGLSNVLVKAIESGAAIALIPRYTPKNLHSALIKFSATILVAIPTMFTHLSKFCEVLKLTLPKTLRYCISGGAAFPKQMIEQFENSLGVRIMEGYGLTESTSALSLNPREKIKPGSIGTPMSGVTMSIINEAGTELPPGQIGEIVVSSPTVAKGYHKLEEESRQLVEHGFLHTGDLGYRDEEGYFYITDRKKDIIICAGENISPREIEEVLLQHPKVEEAAVIGVQMGMRELIKAFVVGNEVTERELLEFCRGKLAPLKAPRAIEFRQMLPKSVTGKVLKKELYPDYRDHTVIEREPRIDV